MKEISRQIKDGERAEKVLVKEEQYKRTSLEAKRLQETVGQTKSWMEEQTAVSAEKEKELQQLEEELQEKEPVFQKQILRLKDILPRYANIRKLEEQYHKQLKKMERVLKECRAASADYEKKYQQFFEEQAGILAKELKEGQPCPVCGSTEHPHRAEILKGAPGQEECSRPRKGGIKKSRSVPPARNSFRHPKAAWTPKENCWRKRRKISWQEVPF